MTARVQVATPPETIEVTVRHVAGPWHPDPDSPDWRQRTWDGDDGNTAARVTRRLGWKVWAPDRSLPIAEGTASTLAEAQAAADAALLAYAAEASKP